jgi:hypothetical protein
MHICLRFFRHETVLTVSDMLRLLLKYLIISTCASTHKVPQVDHDDIYSFFGPIHVTESSLTSIQRLRLHLAHHPCTDAFAVLRIHCCKVFVVHTRAFKSVIWIFRSNNGKTHVISLSVVSNSSISMSLTTVANARYISAYARFNPRHMRVPLPKGTK